MNATRTYRRWILANGWGESIGLGTTLLLGTQLGPYLESNPGPVWILGGALTAVLLGMLLEGVVVGVAQERVLRSTPVRLKSGSWIRATAIGAGLAWLAGMIPSTVMSLAAPASAGASPTVEPAAWITYLAAAGLGLFAGPILGVAQWVVLRRLVDRSGAWLWANALAWAVGMPAVFVGMDIVPWDAPLFVVAASIYLVCFIVGAIAGVIHGRVLVRLVSNHSGVAETT